MTDDTIKKNDGEVCPPESPRKQSQIEKLKRETKAKIVGYVIAGFGFVAALAWNDAIRSLIEQLLPLDRGAVWGKFVYAIIATFLIVIVSVYLVRSADSDQKK